MAEAKRDQNFVPTLLGVSNADGITPVVLWADPVTHRLLVDSAGGGTGTVTSVSVVTANGFAGTVATATTTPAITLTTTVTGVLKGNGTAILQAVAGTDYTDAAFKTIAVSGQSDVVADTAADTLTLVAGTNVTITTNAGTDTITINASGGSSGITIGTTTITSGTDTRILYDNAGVVGEYTLTGTGTVVVMATSPTLVTPVIGVATGTSLSVTGILRSQTSLVLEETGAGTDIITIQAPASIAASYTLTLPVDDGGASEFLQTNGSGVLAWAVPAGTGANTALSNLAAVAINTSLLPATDDGAALGDATHSFSDLFLASGALINFANGNAVITHSSGILTVSTGDLRVTTAGSNAASVVTVGGTQTLTNKTLTSPAINTPTLGGAQTLLENAAFLFDPAMSADGKYNGWTRAGTAGTTLAFGDLIYLDPTDSRWELADANSAQGADGDARGVLGICVLAAAADGDPTTILFYGIVRADTAFPTFTVNNQVYVSETAGDVTNTQPTTTDVVIRVVGVGLTGDELFFNPSGDYITHT